MNNIKGYSDLFAAGFFALSKDRIRRPTSLYSTASTSSSNSSSEYSPPVVVLHPDSFFDYPQPTRRRPASMFLSSTSPNSHHPRASSLAGTKRKFAQFLDRIAFSSSDGDSPSLPDPSRKSKHGRFSSLSSLSLRMKSPLSEKRARRDIWITTGGPRTPSVPNGAPDSSTLHSPLDPFDSSPDSKSYFIDLSESDSSPSHTPKRDSFLSMSTSTGTPNSSPSSTRSISHPIPRKDHQHHHRGISVQTMPLPPTTRSRKSSSSFQLYHRPGWDKTDFWILEEEPDSLPTSPMGDYETRDNAACIDWRQFHNDLLNVEA